MRCECLKCQENEDGYCGCGDGVVGIDENGVCNCLWIRAEDEEAQE